MKVLAVYEGVHARMLGSLRHPTIEPLGWDEIAAKPQSVSFLGQVVSRSSRLSLSTQHIVVLSTRCLPLNRKQEVNSFFRVFCSVSLGKAQVRT